MTHITFTATPQQTYHDLLHADYRNEPLLVRERITQLGWNNMAREQVSDHAAELVHAVRTSKRQTGCKRC